LAASTDPHAEGILRVAYTGLMRQVETIGQVVRQHSFLENVAFHHEIVRASTALRTVSDTTRLGRRRLNKAIMVGQNLLLRVGILYRTISIVRRIMVDSWDSSGFFRR